MEFSKLIEILNNGDSGLIDHNLSSNPEINSAASLEKAEVNQISFIENASYLFNEINQTKASALILGEKVDITEKLDLKNIAWVTVKNPRIAFAEILEEINPTKVFPESIHPSAVIGNNVKIGKNIYIGANVCIDSNTRIGDNSIIHSGVVIYENVVIGKNNELHANCVIHQYSNLGDNCIINSNAVIGSEGFGFIPTKRGWRKMPQTGKVILGDNVEIGSCSTVDRPAVGDTVIGSGTKIDNLVQVGHGVQIGNHCAMASQVGIAGGAKIGDGVILAGQVGVGNRVKVGSNVIASSKCGIHTDIEPEQVVSGFPAIPNKLWLRCAANFKKLPELAKVIKKLNGSV
ncbi:MULTISPECIES: UDP-3-O-(3-hydroxymyristoyl)glucosamine N-acyltransferase [Prochlorococcus]|uniref:UDP-3-O-acylglucosamine N-acyltransferase n=1 Tax=Prochlorococcus marinus (strain SARG / CCMP1375 / SS120) TaxID=167539 RepID=LPXD_PROMA|nr:MULTISPECIES: UDP-3-O-(3-hydroxymyristoyl)glucosamine N-acyltransferase [Prochlorococcus]Q7VC79.1 RecName: Full=UDP-3-O-acylglucosamine N-acyltransferase [Prochlorococcus marinus subsp. marinus str. CCMP1375]AAP99907.1 UDP-3-O-[3-hydroxymyristoyl] glucosamine N-acyltransferase [Prochlorococcus marinus subsp. marinus str. CCMP1375]KGG11745.1 UDP-3-O-(3-hydroxymyristoyl) glucosamine N-acyltransferase [Prochlorococcus marinus str. LG]KGG18841.1 UDP-3-O-(3-hydroxymyristoyl) glucosamine N-acyltra